LLGAETDGQFSHAPEPTAENLAGVGRQVVECQADIGFCQDPDADRLAIIDEQGRYVGEEYTLALCIQHRLSRSVGPVVTNCASSRMSQDIARRFKTACLRSAVGEANVADLMIARQAVYGGEGNGGPIDPRVGYVRDSFVGMAQILDLMTEQPGPISQLVNELPRYAIHKDKIEMPAERLPEAFDLLQARFTDATADRLDGLRLDWADRWLLVRGSNTEPIVRFIAEAPSGAQAQRLCREAAEALGYSL
jgi:phosphomannomutase